MFFDEIAKIEAHESEVLCVEFTPTESGNDMKKFSKYRDATTGFPAKWRQRNERKKFHANDVSVPRSGWCFWLVYANFLA